MQQLASVIALTWLALLTGGYVLARAQDPLPRNLLRNLVQQQFAMERVRWKLTLLAESLAILLLVCTATALACAVLLTRCVMLGVSLYTCLRAEHRHQTTPSGDPVFAWYRRSWPRAF